MFYPTFDIPTNLIVSKEKLDYNNCKFEQFNCYGYF